MIGEIQLFFSNLRRKGKGKDMIPYRWMDGIRAQHPWIDMIVCV